ncbi:MAG: ATP-dependent zinc protease [Planctomycetales bacterium]|nr:ATP-dependent zinc protease [Planctomycetales bacterium]
MASYLSLVFLAATTTLAETPHTAKPLIGQKEVVTVLAPPRNERNKTLALRYVARVDTGAATCSLHAVDVTQDGDQVSFTVFSDDRKTRHRVTAQFVEKKKVITPEGSEERTKVLMRIRIGDRNTISARVTLNDRSRLSHGFLLGRNVLHGYWVDVGRGADLQIPER